MACGIFLDLGSNLSLLHWQVDSLPLSHRGSPLLLVLKKKKSELPPHSHQIMRMSISRPPCAPHGPASAAAKSHRPPLCSHLRAFTLAIPSAMDTVPHIFSRPAFPVIWASAHVSGNLLRDAFLAHSPTPVDNPLPQADI